MAMGSRCIRQTASFEEPHTCVPALPRVLGPYMEEVAIDADCHPILLSGCLTFMEVLTEMCTGTTGCSWMSSVVIAD